MNDVKLNPEVLRFVAALGKKQVRPAEADRLRTFARRQPEGAPDRLAAEAALAEYDKDPVVAASGIKLVPPVASQRSQGSHPGPVARAPYPPASGPDVSTARRRDEGRHSPPGRQPARTPESRDSVSAEKIGAAFHNPYTFLQFPSKEAPRHAPTPRTIDELEKERFTGVLEITVKTLSPLLTSQSLPVSSKSEHKSYQALTIGQDVIVPATGVRGAIRAMMAVLTEGTLGYVDETVWLCQGRDMSLGGSKEAPQN